MKKFTSLLVFFIVSAAFAGPPINRPIAVVGYAKGQQSTTIRSNSGQTIQQSTTTGKASVYRDASGRLVGSSNTQGGTTYVRDARGQILYVLRTN